MKMLARSYVWWILCDKDVESYVSMQLFNLSTNPECTKKNVLFNMTSFIRYAKIFIYTKNKTID